MFNLNNLFSKKANNSNSKAIEIINSSEKVICTYHKNNIWEMQTAVNALKKEYPTPDWSMQKLINRLEARIQEIKDQEKPEVDTNAAEIARLEALAQRYAQEGMPKQAKSVKKELEKLQAKVKKAEAKKEETPTLKGQLLQEIKEKVTPEVAAPSINNAIEYVSAYGLLQSNHRGKCWVDYGGTIVVYEPSLGLKPNKVHEYDSLGTSQKLKFSDPEVEEITAYTYKK